MYFFCLVMMGAGTLGVSRRHWDMAFAGTPLAYEWPGAAYLMMGWSASPAVAASSAAASTSTSRSARCCSASGSRAAPPAAPAQADPAHGADARAAQSYGSWASRPRAPSLLAMVFLVAFVLYYFINWKYLSRYGG